MKKYIFVLLIIINIQIMASEKINNIKNHRSIEISAGISSNILLGTFEISSIILPFHFTVQTSIPFRFVYLFSKKYGLGFTYAIGNRINLLWASSLHSTDIINELKMVNKIGKNIYKNTFIFETGLLTIVRFILGYDASQIYQFLIGPNILFGYEHIINTKCLFVIGGTFDCTFGYGKQEKYSFPIPEDSAIKNKQIDTMFYNYSWGIEFKWKFYYTKNI